MKTLALIFLVASSVLAQPTISTTSIDSLTWGTYYSDTLVATGGTAPRTFWVESGSMPTGIILRGDGVIYGLPSDSSDDGDVCVFRVKDALGAWDNQSITFGIKDSTTGEPPAGGAITLADSARATHAGSTTTTLANVTIPDASGDSANVQLFVWVCKQGSTALIDSVKRGTELLTALVDTVVNANTVVALYTYDGPSAGTTNIVAYHDNQPVKAFAVAYYNVASIGTRQYAEQHYAQSVSDDVSSQADDLVLVFFGYKPDGTCDASDGDLTTLAYEYGNTAYTSWYVGTAPGAATVSYTYTLGSSEYGEMAVVGLYLRP